MEWTKQFEEMTKTWSETQQKMWNGWAETAKNMSASQTQFSWETMLKTWQTTMMQMLDAQADGAKLWVEGMSHMPNMPEDSAEWAKNFQEMTERWTEIQKQMWANWFEMAKELDPMKMAGSDGIVDSAQVTKFWQDTAQTVSNAQTEWMKLWGVSPNGVKE